MWNIKARAGGDLNTDYVLVLIAEQAMSMSISISREERMVDVVVAVGSVGSRILCALWAPLG